MERFRMSGLPRGLEGIGCCVYYLANRRTGERYFGMTLSARQRFTQWRKRLVEPDDWDFVIFERCEDLVEARRLETQVLRIAEKRISRRELLLNKHIPGSGRVFVTSSGVDRIGIWDAANLQRAHMGVRVVRLREFDEGIFWEVTRGQWEHLEVDERIRYLAYIRRN